MNGLARCVFPTAWYSATKSEVRPVGDEVPLDRKPAALSWLRAPAFLVRLTVRAAVALVAPTGCRLCASRLITAADYPLCNRCLADIQELSLAAICTRCGEPLASDAFFGTPSSEALGMECSVCVASPPAFVRATAYGLYNELRPAIRLFKFENTPSLAKPLGAMLARAILHLLPASPAALVVVPVPLFRGKRAYNQSTLLAQQALRVVRTAAPRWTLTLQPGLLRRVRHTESQFLLSPAQRRDNLRGAFQSGGDTKGLNVLLIDDVYTTGATARECTRVLLAAGAKSVRIATLARAGRDIAVRWQGDTASFDRKSAGGVTQGLLHLKRDTTQITQA